MTEEPTAIAPLDRYLASTQVIDWLTPSVHLLARKLVVGIESDAGKARALFEWVRDNIPHSKDVGSETVTCEASDVLREKTGICYAKSHLLAALLRANDIPAGLCYQIYDRDAPFTGRALHGLNGIFLASYGRWFRVDCRGNKPGVDAQFNLEREQIAFPEDPYFDGRVYPEPFPSVVRALNTTGNLSQLWIQLPDSSECG